MTNEEKIALTKEMEMQSDRLAEWSILTREHDVYCNENRQRLTKLIDLIKSKELSNRISGSYVPLSIENQEIAISCLKFVFDVDLDTHTIGFNEALKSI
jgi:hypothetical protein